MSILCRIIVGNDAELLHGVDRQRCHLRRPGQSNCVIHAATVENEILVAAPSAGDAEQRVVLGRARSGVDHDHAGRQSRQ